MSLDDDLLQAAIAGDASKVVALLLEGANSGAQLSGWQPLHLAAQAGCASVVAVLLEHGADPEAAQPIAQRRPLHLAAANGHVRVVQQLLQHGAVVDAVDTFGLSPIHLAARNGRAQVLETLLAAGAANEVLAEHWTPLHMASVQGNPAAVHALLSAGCRLDIATERGSTALHLACHEGHFPIVRLLLEAGADRAAWDHYGRMPVHRAAIGGFVDIMLELGDLNTQDSEGRYPLHYLLDGLARLHPIGPGPARLLRALLAGGADMAAASTFWPTPLDALLMGALWTGGEDDAALSERLGVQTNVPELIGILAAAGCPVDTEGPAPPGGEGEDDPLARRSSTLDWFEGLLEESQRQDIIPRWPHPLGASALAITEALLRQAFAEQPQGRPEFLFTAIEIGSLGLVQLVLQAFPGTAAGWRGQHEESALEAALLCLAGELAKPGLSGLATKQWERQHCPLVTHFCALAEALLSAGCPPVLNLVVRSEGEEVPCPLDGGATEVRLPWWAVTPLSFLPLLVAGEPWSPERHALCPRLFRQAAKQLLLINERRGFGEQAQQQQQRGVEGRAGGAAGRVGQKRAKFDTGDGRQRGIQLPNHVLLHIMGLCARPFPAWLPQLQPFVIPAA